MQKHICSVQISRICNAHESLSDEHMNALYTALVLHYEHGRSAFGVNFLPTDIGSSDNYALVAGMSKYILGIGFKWSVKKDFLVSFTILFFIHEEDPRRNYHEEIVVKK